MYEVEKLTDFLATEPIVEEKPIVTDKVREKWKQLDLNNIKSIVVIMNQGLGDYLLILPLMRTLRKQYPKAKLAIFCDKKYSFVYETTNIVDKIIFFTEEKEEHFDLVINPNPPQEKIEQVISNLFKPKIKVGLKTADRTGYDLLVEDYLVSRPLHYLNFLKILGINNYEMDFKIRLDRKPLEKFNIDKNKRIISLCIGSTWEEKCWSNLKYAALANELTKKGYEVIILGKSVALDESSKGSAILKGINLVDKTTVEEAAQILNISDLVISNDNGLMHLAAALDKRIIALFGISNPAIGGPNSDKTTILNVTKEDCDKVKEHFCTNKICGKCIDNIRVRDVLDLINI